MNFFRKKNIVHEFLKSACKELLFLATKESYFIFNNTLYKYTDRVVMGSPYGSSLANAFLAYHELDWLDRCLWKIEHHILDGMLMI